MNFDSHSPQPTSPEEAPVKVVILYEDFSAGVRASRFAKSIGEALGVACTFQGLWRPEILEFDGPAADAAKAAADADFLIISTRGNAPLAHSTKHWIESWLVTAGARGAAVVALFDPKRSQYRDVESVRCYLRNITHPAAVAFFSHSAVEPEPERDETVSFSEGDQTRTAMDRSRPRPRRRRAPALLAAA